MMKVDIAKTSRMGRIDAKLLVIEGDAISHHSISDLIYLIPENALLVVNTAATLPASFRGRVGFLEIELRLVNNLNHSNQNISNWEALIFYQGDWRIKTEDRKYPDFLEKGDLITIGNLQAVVTGIKHESRRLVEVEFCGDQEFIWEKFYQYGRPIQYSHLVDELNLWDVQTIFSGIPSAVEPPSAAFQLRWDIINQLISKGIEVVGINHATSISSTGNVDLDHYLPFDEYYTIDTFAADKINFQHENNRPIIAVGTSVTRALEDNFMKFGEIKSGRYITKLVIDRDHSRRIITGLFTGMHLPEETHIKLLRNFANEDLLNTAYYEAMNKGYLWHEYGDVSLILP